MSRYTSQNLKQVEFVCDKCNTKEIVLGTNDEGRAEEIIREYDEWILGDKGDFCCRECFNLFIKNNYSPRREVWYILFVL